MVFTSRVGPVLTLPIEFVLRCIVLCFALCCFVLWGVVLFVLLSFYSRGMGPRISADIRGIDPGYSSDDIPGQCHGYLRISRGRQQIMKNVRGVICLTELQVSSLQAWNIWPHIDGLLGANHVGDKRLQAQEPNFGGNLSLHKTYSFVYHAQNGINVFCSSKMNA